MTFPEILKKIRSTQNIPTDWMVRFQYANKYYDSGMAIVTINIDRLFRDWCGEACFCPENDEFIHCIIFGRESTGETYLVETNMEFRFVDMMEQIENMFYSYVRTNTHPYKITLCKGEPEESIELAFLSDTDIKAIKVDAAAQYNIMSITGEVFDIGIIDEYEALSDDLYGPIMRIRIGDVITKQIEEGHCIIRYQLQVTAVDVCNGEISFFGDPVTDDDKEYAEEYGYACNPEDIVLEALPPHCKPSDETPELKTFEAFVTRTGYAKIKAYSTDEAKNKLNKLRFDDISWSDDFIVDGIQEEDNPSTYN